MLCYTSLPTNSVVLQNCGNNFVAVNLAPRPPPPTQNDHVSKPNPPSTPHTLRHAGSGSDGAPDGRLTTCGVAVGGSATCDAPVGGRRQPRSRSRNDAPFLRLPTRCGRPLGVRSHRKGASGLLCTSAGAGGLAGPSMRGAHSGTSVPRSLAAMSLPGLRARFDHCRALFAPARTSQAAAHLFVRGARVVRLTRAREGDTCAGRWGCARFGVPCGCRREDGMWAGSGGGGCER